MGAEPESGSGGRSSKEHDTLQKKQRKKTGIFVEKKYDIASKTHYVQKTERIIPPAPAPAPVPLQAPVRAS